MLGQITYNGISLGEVADFGKINMMQNENMNEPQNQQSFQTSAFVLKKCTCCRLEFPKTEYYFFAKIIKQQNKSELAIYHSFRAICKSCNNKKGKANRIKKRCKEMKCDVSDYRKNWKKQYSETRTFVKEITHLTKGVQGVIRKKIKDGYVFSNYEQYRIDCRKNVSQVKRKYDYGDVDFVPKEKLSRSGIINLTDAYIALTLKAKVKEVPKEMIDFKRLTIQLRRELSNLKTI